MYQKDKVSGELANFDRLPDTANVRLPTVKQMYGVSAATVWRLSWKSIPAPRKLAERITAWNVGELRVALGVKKGA
jgi:predicted DNA-binding transcriptional regulator AlpA